MKTLEINNYLIDTLRVSVDPEGDLRLNFSSNKSTQYIKKEKVPEFLRFVQANTWVTR